MTLPKHPTQKFWKNIYRKYRNPFIIIMMRRYNCDKETAKDMFQSTVMSLHESIQSGKSIKLTVPLYQYLYAIGKHKVLNELKRKASYKQKISELASPTSIDTQTKHYRQQHIKTLLKETFQQSSDKDQKIVQLYYYEGYCLEAIAINMGYKNANVVKNKKYIYLKKLKQKLSVAAMF